MLIRFTAENYRSFDEEAVFSLIPSSVTKHPHHIIKGQGHGIDVLRIGLIYGANASGKSNLIRAMAFARDLIVDGTRPKRYISVEPFRLRAERLHQPTRFEFEFVVSQKAYAYGMVVDRWRVHEEWLFEVTTKGERPLFERTTAEDDTTHVTFGPKVVKKSDQTFLDGVARGTRPNQLFLTETAERNVPNFAPMYSWFDNTLQIVFPETRAQNIAVGVHMDQRFSHVLANFLKAMGTGIDEVCMTPIDLESVDIPLEFIQEQFDTDSSLENQTKLVVVMSHAGHRYLFGRQTDNELEAYRLSTRHLGNGEKITFDILEESDGTRRLFDLFPMLYNPQPKVYVVDELERSLHPNLVRQFIEQFLTTANANENGQLIVTTHEATLLDLELLRRDEVWLVEKNQGGASQLYSLEAFKPRHDLDIRKGYLQGRFGAIPVFGHALQPTGVES